MLRSVIVLILLGGLCAACLVNNVPSSEADLPGAGEYEAARGVFYQVLKKAAPSFVPADEPTFLRDLTSAEINYPKLYEHLMGFFPYATCAEDPSIAVPDYQTLAREMASELLWSIPDKSPAKDFSSVAATLMGAGYQVRREPPPSQRFARQTGRTVRSQSLWADLQLGKAFRRSTGKGIRVAIVDTGLDPTIQDLRSRVVDFRDFLSGDPPAREQHFPYDWNGHGTAVASIVSRVAPGADLLIARSLDGESMDRVPGNWWTLTLLEAGIAWAAGQGADVINMSFAVRIDVTRLRNLIQRCWERNIILVASMANVAEEPPPGTVFYPAAYPGTIAVGSVEKRAEGWRVWEHSPGADYLDIVAPGCSIWVEQPSYLEGRSTTRKAYGSSFAAATLSGTAALVLAAMDPAERAELKRTPGALCERVLQILCQTASNEKLGLSGFNTRSGWGLVDPAGAVERARQSKGAWHRAGAARFARDPIDKGGRPSSADAQAGRAY